VFAGSAAFATAQTIPAATGPDGVGPESPAPSATATSPGTTLQALPAVNPARAPTPEIRDTSPGARATLPGVSRPSLGVPTRVAAPDAPQPVRDPVEPVLSIGPSDRVPPPPRPTTPGDAQSVPAMQSVPRAPSVVPPAAVPSVPAVPPAPVPTAPRISMATLSRSMAGLPALPIPDR
jgi:hypothetical protein